MLRFKIIGTNSKRTSDGFTIAEVSIATGVFAIVLLVGLASFISLSRLFYKGVAVAQTQDVSQQILQDISGSIQSGKDIYPEKVSATGYHYYCLGKTRYTFIIGNAVDVSSTVNHDPAGGNFGLLKDSLTDNTCAAPCSDTHNPLPTCNSPDARLNKPVELLGQNMRLDQLSIVPNCSADGTCDDTYSVNLIVAYGSDDVFDYGNPGPPPVYQTITGCKAGSQISTFCSVNRISTSVYKNLNF